MKILVIHNFYKISGGEDVVFQSEVDLLSQYGHEVETLIFTNDHLRGGLSGIFWGALSFYNPCSAKRLRAKIEQFRPALIHVHNIFPVASPSIFYVGAKWGIPVVATLHNYRLICPSSVLLYKGQIYERSIHRIFPLDAVMKGVYRESRLQSALVAGMTGFHKLVGTWTTKVSRFIVPSNFARDMFIKSSLKIPEERLLVKPNFTFDQGYELEKDDYYLFIGRLSSEKGIETVIEAARITGRDIRIVGDGDLKQLVENAASANPNVSYLGRMERSDVFHMLKKAKALIFPSSCYETFGMTIVEAFSTATPVIVSNIGGHSELVAESENGFRFRVNNAEDLSAKLLALDDQRCYRTLCINARKTYEDFYTPRKNYQMIMQIYQDAIISAKV